MVGNKSSNTFKKNLPEGTVTFLFTDIEGSTNLLRQLGDEYAIVLADQRRILREIFAKWHGREVDTQGDSFFVSFARATEAVAAAVEIQRTLSEHQWPQDVEVRVRMGLHTGEPLTAEEGYVGMDVHRAARIAHVGHGGQVLLSETTAALLKEGLPKGVSLLDLGRHRLKDMAYPERIRQLVLPRLPSEFPSLKSLETLGTDTPVADSIRLPAFLEEDAAEGPAPVFVGRQQELDRLRDQLDMAVNGQGGVYFIAGDAGGGKTALMNAFTRKSLELYPDLLAAWGACSAFTGSGDPYAPFRTVLRQLTGDVETAWRGGRIHKEEARRLWTSIPLAARALIKCGPHLINTIISGPTLLERLSTAVPADGVLQKQINDLVEGDKAAPGPMEQKGLFEEVRDVLVEMSESVPLLILLDDMQWADSGSINLLFHLGRELAGSRVLVVSAYRPEDVALGRDDAKHPLEPVLNELKRTISEVWIDLNQVSGEHFVNQLIDTEPNHLDTPFREKLYKHTAGHALFTVELLRDLQERGDLIQDRDGFWIEGPELDWTRLPTRVEGVIASRVGRLEDELREILTIASVEGEDFTAQVIAQVQEVQERKLLQTLSRELERQHKLVKEGDTVRIGSKLLSRYRFSHALFQRYLYNDLSAGERSLLHGEIGAILEELYADRLDEIAVQLGRHFAAAGDPSRASPYLLRAAEFARMSFALNEAADLYNQALSAQKELGEKQQASRTLMKLGLIYHNMLDFSRSREVYGAAFALMQQVAKQYSSSHPPAAGSLEFRSWLSIEKVPDHGLHNEAYLGIYSKLLFSGLVKLDVNGIDVLPRSAESWEIHDQGKKYIFRLRDDLFWSDGVPLTAQDFEYAWKRVLDPATASPTANLLFDLQNAKEYHLGEIDDPNLVGVDAQDNQTLVVNLEGPTGYFLQLLTHEVTFPVPRHTIQRHGTDWNSFSNVTTCGPFKMEGYGLDDSLSFSNNPDYPLPRKGNVSRIQIQMAIPKDEAERRRNLKRNVELYAIDQTSFLNLNLRQEEFYQLIQKYNDDYVQAPYPGSTALYLNSSITPFNDRRVRQALAMSIDREYIANAIECDEMPAFGGFISPGIPGHSKDIGWAYELNKAKDLIAEAGYPGGRNFPDVVFAWTHYAPIVDYVINRWRSDLGISVSWKQASLDVATQYPMTRIGWINDYPDPDSFLRANPYMAAAGGDRQDEYDQIIEKARRTMDQEQRTRLYKRADRILVEEAVIIPITYSVSHRLVKPWLKNFIGPLFEYGSWEDFIVEPH